MIRNELRQRWGKPVELGSLGGYLGRNQSFLVNGDAAVLKLFHLDGETRCEREVTAYRLAEAAGIPVPAVLDRGRFSDGTPWMCASHVPGVVLEDVQANLGDEVVARLYGELGRNLARLHQAAFERAPALHAPSADARFAGWSNDLLSRAFPQKRLFELAAAKARALQSIVSNRDLALLHRDASARNLLVTKKAEGWRIAALIDFELAIIGDPMEDIAKVAFKEFERTPPGRAAFLAAYAEALPFPDRANERLTLNLLYWTFSIARWRMEDDHGFFGHAVRTLERVMDGDPIYSIGIR